MARTQAIFQQPAEDDLERRARALFANSVERLDARTRSRLTQARHAALDELKRPHPLRARWLWAPAAGLAAAAAAAVMINVGSGSDPAPPSVAALEDLDVVVEVEELELLRDVEFYAWLAEQAPAGADPGSG